MYGRGRKLSKPKTQNIRNPFILKNQKSKDIHDRIIRVTWTFLKQKIKKKEKRKLERKKKLNKRLIKVRIIRDRHFLNKKKKIIINLKE